MMHTIVEISMYPLADDFITPINSFIEHLHSYEGIAIRTDDTATELAGEYEAVMSCLSAAIAWGREHCGQVVFVTKIIPGYTP